MPFVCGGYPAPGVLPTLLGRLEAAGASIIEIGFPFSDPIADGPVIASAMHEALGRGATARSVLDEVASVRGSLKVGLVAMVSVSIVHRCGGPSGFSSAARQAGIDGLIVPDAPFSESRALVDAAGEHGLTFSQMISPTTTLARAEEIVKVCTGFVYLLARAGITGEQAGMPDIGGRVSRLRQMTPLPIACGFGISTPAHVREVVRHADAAIVGSALVTRMRAAMEADADPVAAAAMFTRELAEGLPGERPREGLVEVGGPRDGGAIGGGSVGGGLP